MRGIGLAVASAFVVFGVAGTERSWAQAGRVGQADPATKYRIAGVHRMMSSADVKKTLEQAGYSLESDQTSASFEQRVAGAKARAAGNNSYVSGNDVRPSFQQWKKGGEEIGVWYVPAPTDSRVKAAFYQAAGGMADPAAMKATLVQRYGPPGLNKGGSTSWCAAPARGCKSDQNYLSIYNTRIDIGGPSPDDVQVSRMVEAAARGQGGARPQTF